MEEMQTRKYMVFLTDDEQRFLQELLQRQPPVRQRVRVRASLLLMAAQGMSGNKIAERLGISRATVTNVCRRFVQEGFERAVYDLPQTRRAKTRPTNCGPNFFSADEKRPGLYLQYRGEKICFPQITHEEEDRVFWLVSTEFTSPEALIDALKASGVDFACRGLSIWAPRESIEQVLSWLRAQRGLDEEPGEYGCN